MNGHTSAVNKNLRHTSKCLLLSYPKHANNNCVNTRVKLTKIVICLAEQARRRKGSVMQEKVGLYIGRVYGSDIVFRRSRYTDSIRCIGEAN